MSRITTTTHRSTMLLSSNQLNSSLRRSQSQISDLQNALSTGLSVRKPSDAPEKSAAILALQSTIEARGQYNRNLSHAGNLLNTAEATLADVNDLLLEARTIASSQVGVGSNAETRKQEASVIDAQIRAMIDLSNRKLEGVSLFGGKTGAAEDGDVFVEQLGGIRYIGDARELTLDTDGASINFNTNGQTAFNALSSRVISDIDLDPQLTAGTRLRDLTGAQGEGVRLSSVQVSVNGTPVAVDLAGSGSVDDILVRINDAINSVDPTAGAAAINGSAIDLTANAGHTIAITDIGSGQTAADLGINGAATGATFAGSDLDPKVTDLTDLGALGAGIDWTSGLSISHGPKTKVADFSTATNVQDLKNIIEQLDMGVRLEINDDQTGVNLISDISGIDLSIGENGGTTAEDLGLRTMGTATLLSDFRFGLGVENAEGEDDFEVRLHDGTVFAVNIDGLTTVGEVVGEIANAATAAGLTVGTPGTGGTDFNVGLATTGNGFMFEDGTVGGAAFEIRDIGQSLAAQHLGIHQGAGANTTITGDDHAKVRVESVFSHLIALRDSLLADDTRGITLAGGKVENDLDHLSQARASLSVRAQEVERQQERSSEMDIADKSLLSELRDTNFTEAITRFTQLQQQMEASLRVGSANLQLNLLDFLR